MQQAVLKMAPPYDERDVERIKQEMEAKLGQRLTWQVTDDDTLIGGFCLFVGGKVYDASLKTQLDQLRALLTD